MKSIARFFQGILLGAGAILPGISSGVMCVIFGIYEKLLNAVLDFFSDWKKNLFFLLPLALGAVLGVVLLGNVLKYLFSTFAMPTSFAFMGLILGCIPSVLKQANVKKISPSHILCLCIALFVSLALFIVENGSSENETIATSNISIFKLIQSGFFMSAGIVIPGMSSSVILMLQGTYGTYLEAVSNPLANLQIIIPMGIGVIAGSILFLVLIKFLLDKFHSQTYYAIVGFVLGALPVLYPGFEFSLTGFISIALFAICLYISMYFESLN